MSLRLTTLALLALVGSLAHQDAASLGLGRVQSSAVLGQTLEMAIGVRLDADESLTVECVSAEVSLGDARLPRSSVGVSLDTSGPTPVIKVRTLERIDEPVVTVTVSAGCGSRVARQFTLFPDPPGIGPAAPPVAEAANLSVAGPAASTSQAEPAPAAVTRPSGPASPAAPVAPATSATPATPATASSTAAPAGQLPRPLDAPASSASVQTRVPSTAAAAAPRPARPASEPSAAPRPRPKAPAPIAAASAQRSEPKLAAEPPAKPRLKLDAPTLSAAAAAAAASAAQRELALKAAEEAASAAKGAATQAANRVAELEKGMEALRVEAKANREAMERMTRQLAESQSRADWMPVMMVAVLALAVVAGVLAWRLRKRAESREEWWASNQAAPATGLPEQPAEAKAGDDSIFPVSIAPDSVMPEPVQRSRTAPDPALAEPRTKTASAATGSSAQTSAAPVASPAPVSRPDLSTQATMVLPPGSVAPGSSVRDMSVEELLDLEQQAEFFTVLGQDDAAIDLLLEHLRGTGGTVPLPYLKLMEIYRRMDDREAYERMRERFNQRFNAVASAWETEPGAGRTLEDYPTVIQRLQRDWARPVDAMATLETLLFRADGGQVFDLPAYNEVMFLYGLAHDLIADSGAQGSRIDVMLPLGDDTPAAPRPTGPVPDNLEVDIQVEDQVTLPLPLELPPSAGGPKTPGPRKT